ncbi:hypothetical protein CHS0354_023043 [Potamilus streckersoni]|uniref:Cytochrome b5 heme-binding domain-containing protein n=1 Tax=Potamilus streckersoni TaxID=2493646 RepID=A0AAE0RWB4_9BIVA|nr:hypothetical protein CHS0354_023043 [Potamilus streckersoni]
MAAPVMTQFLAVFACLLISIFCEKYKPIEIELQSEINGEPARIFTAEEIRKYDGSDPKKPIYMGVRGVVFDVSDGKGFYGKGSEYNALVGKDATRAVAIWSLEPDDLVPDVNDLPDFKLKMLDETFQETYMRKYPVVGYMDYLVEQKEFEKIANSKEKTISMEKKNDRNSDKTENKLQEESLQGDTQNDNLDAIKKTSDEVFKNIPQTLLAQHEEL